ncbi:hypothetical protein WA577_002108 [Blastocystis sp. JDR]
MIPMENDFSASALERIRTEFLQSFPSLLDRIERILTNDFSIPEELRANVLEMVRYNVLGGKMIRGLFSVYSAYAMSGEWDDKRKEQCFLQGWCAELLQAAFLIADDIMDEAETRRGKTAWYRVKKVGMMSINDTFILQSLIPKLLKEVIDSPMVYCNVVRVFEDIKLRTEVGQMLDLSTVAVDTHSLNYKYFTDDYYREIIVNKTAYYTVFLPVYLGLVLAQCDSSLLRSELLQEWCVLLGCYFQVRDDYLDVFADASVLKKEGTDIQEGKCSWVVLTVLSMGSEEDRAAIHQHYGKKEKEDVRVVKEVFSKYDVKSRFLRYEEDALQRIRAILSSFPEKRFVPFMQFFTETLFGRV